jgi:tetratricopeptide (TPR) repeat protein
MMKPILPLVVSLLIIGCISILFGQELEIGTDTNYKEVGVKEGEEFKIRIEGSGWYLNRYDRQHLSFTRRFLEPSHTSFTIYAKKIGQAYLIFSYLDRDIYVMVNIEHTPSATEPATTEVPPSESNIPDAQDETILKEKEPHKEESPEVVETKKIVPEVEPETGSEIYYIDKEKKIVPVPFIDEDDPYRKGVRLFERGAYSEAQSKFAEYLEGCKSCKYRIEATMKLAEIYLAAGKNEEAGLLFDKVIDSKKDQYMSEALIKRGDIFFKEGNLETASEYYQKALGYVKDNAKLLRRVADIHYELNNYGLAINEYEELRESSKVDDELLFRIATIYDSPAGPRDIQKAYNYYKLLIDKFPTSKHSSFARKRIKFMDKNFFNYK